MSYHGTLKVDTPNDLESSWEKFPTSLGKLKIGKVKATMKAFMRLSSPETSDTITFQCDNLSETI